MKKFITIALVGALILGMAVTGVAFANEGGDEKGKQFPQMGTVVQKNENGILLTAPGMDFIHITVTTTDQTEYYDGTAEREKGEEPAKISITDIKKGDKVVVHGIIKKADDVPTKFIANKVVKVNEFPRPGRPGDDKSKDQASTMNVLFKSANGNTITVTGPSGEKEFVITLADEAKVFKIVKGEEDEKPTREEVQISSLSAGDKLVITAKRSKDDEGNVVATARFILVVDEFPPQRGGDDNKGKDDKSGHEVMGTFAGFDGDYILITPNKEDAQQMRIKISDDTKYVKFEKTEDDKKPEKIDMAKSDLRVGQKVTLHVVPVRGEDEGSREAMAKVVVFIDEFPPGRAGGEITAINANSITIKLRNGEEVSFEITNETRFELHKKGEKEATEGKKSDFKKGDQVGIMFKDGVALLITKRVE